MLLCLVLDTTSTPLAATHELLRKRPRVCALDPNANNSTNVSTGDAHSVAADIKSHLPGRSPNAEGELKGAGAAAGAKIDSVVRLFAQNTTIVFQ